MMMMYTEN